MNVYRKWCTSGRTTSKSSKSWFLTQLIFLCRFIIGAVTKYSEDKSNIEARDKRFEGKICDKLNCAIAYPAISHYFNRYYKNK